MHDREDIHAMDAHIHVVVDNIEVNIDHVDDGDHGFIDDEEEEILTHFGSEESEEADDSDDSDYVWSIVVRNNVFHLIYNGKSFFDL